MVDVKCSVGLSEYCYNACEMSEKAVRGKGAVILNGFEMALRDSKGCTDLPSSSSCLRMAGGHERYIAAASSIVTPQSQSSLAIDTQAQ